MFILKNSNNEIVGFSEAAFTLSSGQSQEEIAGTLVEYSQRLRITADKTTILANGVDAAQVTIHSSTNAPTISIDVDGIAFVVTMTNGQGTLLPIVSEVVDSIFIQPADQTLYSAAGEGALTIEAV